MEVNIQTIILWVLYQFLGLQCFRNGNTLNSMSSHEWGGRWLPMDNMHLFLRNNNWRKRTESLNTYNRIKRFFEFSPAAFNQGKEDISLDASRNDPIHFSPFITSIEGYRKYSKPQRPQPKFKSTYIKTGEASEHVNPYVDHFSGIKSFILHFNNRNRYDTISANYHNEINDDKEGHIGDISMRAYLQPVETEAETMLVSEPFSFPNNKKSNDIFYPLLSEYDDNHSEHRLESKHTELKDHDDNPFTDTEYILQFSDSHDDENDTYKTGSAMPAPSRLLGAITNTPKEYVSDVDDINYALFESKNNLNKKVKMQENLYQQDSMHYQGDESLTQLNYDQQTQHIDGLDNSKPFNNIETNHGSVGNAMEGISPNTDHFGFADSDSFGQSGDTNSNQFSLERTDELQGADRPFSNNFDFGRFGSIVEPNVNGFERPTAEVEDFSDTDDHKPYFGLGLQSNDEFQPYDGNVGSFSYDDSNCDDIDTRSCTSNGECSCYGLYQCYENRCISTEYLAPELDSQHAPVGQWYEEPIDVDYWSK